MLLTWLAAAVLIVPTASHQRGGGSTFTTTFSSSQLRSSGSTLAVSVTAACGGAVPANGSAYWLGMFTSDANLTADPNFRDYCPPGGCAPTTPPWTSTAPIKFWGLPSTRGCGWTESVAVVVVNYRKPLIFAIFSSFEAPQLVYKSE